MKILVYCANGLQGQSVVHQLLKRGHQVRALVRDTNRASPLAAAGAEIVFADLDSDDLTNLERAHEGIDYVILQLTAGDDGPTRKKKGLRALECTRRGRGIKGVIFNASFQYPRHIEELPTWVATKGIEDELGRSEIPFSVIHPTFYLDNLLLPYATYSIASRGVLAYPISEQLLRGIGTNHSIPKPGFGQFELSIDQAIGPGVGKRVSAIFRFIERHPDDLEFLARPFVQPAQMPAFEATDVTKWVAVHKAAYAMMPAPQAANA